MPLSLYIGLFAIILFGVLLLIINLKNKKIDALKAENTTLKVDKELSDVKENADKAKQTYTDAKLEYDDFKSRMLNNPTEKSN